MGKKNIFTRNIKIFTCAAAWGTRKYERDKCFVGALSPQKSSDKKSDKANLTRDSAEVNDNMATMAAILDDIFGQIWTNPMPA